MKIFYSILQEIKVIYFAIKTLSYNSCRSKHHYTDAAFEPIFWFVDHFTNYLGIIFVGAVILLTASVVAFWYIFLRPVIDTYNTNWMFLHYIYAHWLLLNIVFNYFKAVFTDPGHPPQGKPMDKLQGAVVCKKCIQPKPPRTHHCSICNRCVLKMDHHCPWMNNCIGFFNHRYFTLFCIYMWLGVVYVSWSCSDLFWYHFFHPGTLMDKAKQMTSLKFAFGLSPVFESFLKMVDETAEMGGGVEEINENYRPHPGGFQTVWEWEHVGIIYLFLLCSAVVIALGALNCWHIILISRGETSIEVHINTSERKKAAKRGMGYNNQYHYGVLKNWKRLLGLHHQRSFLRILFPSSHLPYGDGCSWETNGRAQHYPDAKARERFEHSKDRKKWCKCLC